jgi:hypothetical protein
VSQSEWVESGLVPTYISGTSFSVPGDQTPILQINRRVRTTNTSGFIYSTISNSVFAAGITTVTLVNSAGVLDAGLSLVAYGLLSASNSAIPIIQIAGGGTGQTTALAAFDALKQPASETYTGVVEKLTTAEAQAGTDDTRYHSAATMKAAQIQLGTAVTLTNQTSVDFPSAPTWAKRGNLMFVGVSTNGTSNPIVQIGDAGGIENTGYLGASSSMDTGVATTNYTTGFGIRSSAAAAVFHGSMVIEKQNGNTWVARGDFGGSSAAFCIVSSGSKSLSDVLDRVRLTTAGGTDQFDAGSVNISWE